MNPKKINTSLMLFFGTMLCVLMSLGPMALAARVAGQEGVTPSSTNTGPPPPGRDSDNEKIQPVKGSSPITEEEPKKGEPETRYVTIDFDNVDIQVFIKFISELTGKNFIVDNAVRGNVTVISPSKITIDEAYKVFESVLEVHGFTTVPAGSVIKVIPSVEARSKDIETRLKKEGIDPEDKIVTQIIPLRYAQPEDLRKLLTPFISKSSILVSYPPTGMLILTDVLSNIRRILEIVEVIDVMGTGAEISLIPLEHGVSAEMAKLLTSIFQTGTRTDPKQAATSEPVIRIVSDERTNTLIIVASENDTARIKQLISLLDKETPKGEGDIHVYYLQNANAEDLAGVLTSLPTEQTEEVEKGKAPVISKEVQIVADKSTNSLIITAKKSDYLVLEEVIKKLDIPRRMVYIEALIMEVSMSEQFDLGVEWFGAKSAGTFEGNDVAAFGGSNPETGVFPSLSDSGSAIFAPGFSFGVLGDVITIGGMQFNSIGAAIRALRTNSDVRILSTPQIMTTDNEEAEITVADNIPFLTKQDTTASGVDYSNYEFKDVGVTLNITPQINQERFVRLKISQEVSQVVEQQKVGLPTTLKRLAKTTITIKDGQTVVIGGLIDETENTTNYKVPVLGDIPLLGLLFRSYTETGDQKNLFIFITPHIIENPDEAQDVFEEKKEYIEKIEEGVIKMYGSTTKQSEDMRLSDQGFHYLEVNDYEHAMKLFEKAIDINPENPYALLNMGVVFEKLGKKDDAISMYEKVIMLDSDERAIYSTDPMNKGKKLTDIARKNLENLRRNNH